MELPIKIEQIPALTVLSLREKISSFPEQGRLWTELRAFMESNSIPISGPGVAVLHNACDIDVQVCFPIDMSIHIPDQDRFKIETLPSQKMAIITHTDQLHRIAESYEVIMKWLEDRKMKVVGSSREVYVSLPANLCDNSQDCAGSGDTTRIEIQFPVE